MRARRCLVALAALLVTLAGCGGEVGPPDVAKPRLTTGQPHAPGPSPTYRPGTYADWKRDREAWWEEHIAAEWRLLKAAQEGWGAAQDRKREARAAGLVSAEAREEASEKFWGKQVEEHEENVAALVAEMNRLFPEPKVGR